MSGRALRSSVIALFVGVLMSGCIVAEPPPPVVAGPPPAAPPPQVEVAPPPPGPAYVWVPGHWAWRRGGYVWVPGHYAVPAQPGYVWVAPHWAPRFVHTSLPILRTSECRFVSPASPPSC